MDLLLAIANSWMTTFCWLAGLAVVFGLLARLMPCNPGMYWWKDARAVGADLVYWFIVPMFLHVLRLVLLVAAIAFVLGGHDPEFLPTRQLPFWVQVLGILLIQDVMLYWIHRFFHTRPAWAFHAIHHSPTMLDWTASSRSHPVNNFMTFCMPDVAVLLMGFAPAALLLVAGFNLVHSAMVHANLNWTFGPLRYVLASPVFHRWHHTSEAEGLDKNFATNFAFLDVLFGTFYMPPGQLPQEYGNGDGHFPKGFWGQFAYPFRRRKAAANTVGATAARYEVISVKAATVLPSAPVTSDAAEADENARRSVDLSV